MINPAEIYKNFCDDVLAWKKDGCPVPAVIPFTKSEGLCINLHRWLKHNKYSIDEQLVVYSYQLDLFNDISFPFGDFKTYIHERKSLTIYDNDARMAHIKKHSSQ